MGQRRLTRDRVSKAFAKVLVRARNDAEMTQEQLADATKMHRTTIGLLERGLRCPSLDTVMRLALAMQIEAADLVGLVDEELEN